MNAQFPRVPLPSPETIRADVQRMVDFGPRLPGYEGHDRFCTWLVDEFVAAGLELLPCDHRRTRTRAGPWTVTRRSLPSWRHSTARSR